MACYKKPCTSILTSESWFAVRFTYYHSVYLKLVNEACELCNSMQEYDKVQKICGQVLANDELSEDAHYWLIKNWIGLGDTDNALKQYETAVKILYEKLGTYSSRKMQELYDEILGMNQNASQATLEDIYGEIQEQDPEGVFSANTRYSEKSTAWKPEELCAPESQNMLCFLPFSWICRINRQIRPGYNITGKKPAQNSGRC